MRFSRFHLALSVLIFSLVLASPAFANSVQLKYVGHGGAVAQNGSPYVGYPYLVSINGSNNFTALMCDSYDNNVSLGQTWTATATPFLAGISNSIFGSSMIMDYKAAGLIFKSMLAGNLSANTAQWAIWGLFSTNAANSVYFLHNPGFASVEATYLALA